MTALVALPRDVLVSLLISDIQQYLEDHRIPAANQEKPPTLRDGGRFFRYGWQKLTHHFSHNPYRLPAGCYLSCMGFFIVAIFFHYHDARGVQWASLLPLMVQVTLFLFPPILAN